jgi:hypothetical protein
MNLQARIDLVKRTVQERFPGGRYTIKVTIWDDGIDEIKGLHRDDDKMHVFTYFDGEMDYDIISLKKEPQEETPAPVQVVEEPKFEAKEIKFEDLKGPNDHLGSEPIFKDCPIAEEEIEATEVVMVEGYPIKKELMQEIDYPEPPDEPRVPSAESLSTWKKYREAIKDFFNRHKNNELR